VEGMAACLAAQVRAFGARGPWIIAGKCIGGTVAFELARQLAEAGDPVAFLALFGAPYPTFFRPLNRLRHHAEERARLWRRRIQLLAGQSNRERLDYVIWRL